MALSNLSFCVFQVQDWQEQVVFPEVALLSYSVYGGFVNELLHRTCVDMHISKLYE